jgi:hypothetical protein
MATQLRDYTIAEGELDRFIEEWRRWIVPLRQEAGFTVDGAWTVEGESRFVWLLSHSGGWDAFETADRAYYASPGRTGLDPDPARLIAEQRVGQLAAVELPRG